MSEWSPVNVHSFQMNSSVITRQSTRSSGRSDTKRHVTSRMVTRAVTRSRKRHAKIPHWRPSQFHALLLRIPVQPFDLSLSRDFRFESVSYRGKTRCHYNCLDWDLLIVCQFHFYHWKRIKTSMIGRIEVIFEVDACFPSIRNFRSSVETFKLFYEAFGLTPCCDQKSFNQSLIIMNVW